MNASSIIDVCWVTGPFKSQQHLKWQYASESIAHRGGSVTIDAAVYGTAVHWEGSGCWWSVSLQDELCRRTMWSPPQQSTETRDASRSLEEYHIHEDGKGWQKEGLVHVALSRGDHHHLFALLPVWLHPLFLCAIVSSVDVFLSFYLLTFS